MVSVRIESVQQHGTSAGWTGRVDGAQDYTVIYTVNGRHAFASISAPQGSFSMESVDGKGVVYRNPEMGDVASPGSKDYLLPDHADPAG